MWCVCVCVSLGLEELDGTMLDLQISLVMNDTYLGLTSLQEMVAYFVTKAVEVLFDPK